MKFSRRTFIEAAGALALRLSIGPTSLPDQQAYSANTMGSDITTEYPWTNDPEIIRNLQTIDAAKAYAKSLGLRLPETDFFDTSKQPQKDADRTLTICTGIDKDIILPFEEPVEIVYDPKEPPVKIPGCYSVKPEEEEKYMKSFFQPLGLEGNLYRDKSVANASGQLTQKLLDKSSAHTAIAILHESIHVDLDNEPAKPPRSIEEPAAEAFALKHAPLFAHEHPELIDQQQLQQQIETRALTLLGTSATALAVQLDPLNTDQYLAGIGIAVASIAKRTGAIDPGLEDALQSNNPGTNTASVQRNVTYSAYFPDLLTAANKTENPHDYIDLLRNLPEQPEAAIDAIRNYNQTD